MSGMSPAIRKTLFLGGVKPDTYTKDRSQRKLRYFPDLDSAVGKAEDTLITIMYRPSYDSEHFGRHVLKGTGFQRCLSHIDTQVNPTVLITISISCEKPGSSNSFHCLTQHETTFKEDLAELGSYTYPVTLEPGEILYKDKIFVDRGLFFIEEGTLRIERSTDSTGSLTRTRRSTGTYNNFDSIGHLKARSGSVARQVALLKDQKQYDMQTFRLARIGPGWVIGNHEALSGLESPGATIAVDRCRLHYISFDKLKDLEEGKPMLILQLYKLLSKLHALQSEVQIGQFATLYNIMSAPSHNRPLLTRGTISRP